MFACELLRGRGAGGTNWHPGATQTNPPIPPQLSPQTHVKIQSEAYGVMWGRFELLDRAKQAHSWVILLDYLFSLQNHTVYSLGNDSMRFKFTFKSTCAHDPSLVHGHGTVGKARVWRLRVEGNRYWGPGKWGPGRRVLGV